MQKCLIPTSSSIVFAINVGIMVDDPTAVLDLWLRFSRKMSARIAIMDVVADEVVIGNPSSKHAVVFRSWMNSSGILADLTNVRPSSQWVLDFSGSLAVIDYIVRNDIAPLDVGIISDKIFFTQFEFWERYTPFSEEKIFKFIDDSVMTSSWALNICSVSAGINFDSYNDLAKSYQAVHEIFR